MLKEDFWFQIRYSQFCLRWDIVPVWGRRGRSRPGPLHRMLRKNGGQLVQHFGPRDGGRSGHRPLPWSIHHGSLMQAQCLCDFRRPVQHCGQGSRAHGTQAYFWPPIFINIVYDYLSLRPAFLRLLLFGVDVDWKCSYGNYILNLSHK